MAEYISYPKNQHLNTDNENGEILVKNGNVLYSFVNG